MSAAIRPRNRANNQILERPRRVRDLTGMVFGRWTVLGYAGRSKTGLTKWMCRCKCGTVKAIQGTGFANGHSRSCGCSYRIGDLSGKRFGRWLVLSRAQSRHRWPMWNCRCECGVNRKVAQNSLVRGTSRSCGCLAAELFGDRRRTHGLSFTPTERIWRGMITRCHNPNATSYERYGGRGIIVCERWRNSVLAFVEDMGLRPSSRHSIDRIDSNGNYEPGNCRWITSGEQRRNRKDVHLLTYCGKTQCLSDWARDLEITRCRLRNLLRCFNGSMKQVARHLATESSR